MNDTGGGTGNVHEFLNGVLEGGHRPIDAPSETVWREAWTARRIAGGAPIATALSGGALADRLAWVFLTGYQAALQRCFPERRREGWSAYLIAEDPDGKVPGVTVREAGGAARLTGHKTWVAACDHVERLVVTVGTGRERRFYLVDRESLGVTVEANRAASFLGEMSQGRAVFDGAVVDADHVLVDPSRALAFAAAEPVHVLTALNAFMLSHAVRLDGGPSVRGRALATLLALHGLSTYELASTPVALGMVGIEAETQATAEEFELLITERDPLLLERWMRDRRLVSMFHRGVLQRAEWASSPASPGDARG